MTERYKAESFIPPSSAVSNAKKGLEMRKKWKRGGLTPAEAKSQGIDSGLTRARKIASGKVSRHDVKRMSAFNRHRKNYRPSKKKPDGGPTAGTIAWLLWGGTSGVNWAKKQSAALGAEEYLDYNKKGICDKVAISETKKLLSQGIDDFFVIEGYVWTKSADANEWDYPDPHTWIKLNDGTLIDPSERQYDEEGGIVERIDTIAYDQNNEFYKKAKWYKPNEFLEMWDNILKGAEESLAAEGEEESIYDILKSFNIEKNVELGLTHEKWIGLLNTLEDMMPMPILEGHDENIYDILKTFAVVKNVEMGMTQQQWIEMIEMFEESLSTPYEDDDDDYDPDDEPIEMNCPHCGLFHVFNHNHWSAVICIKSRGGCGKEIKNPKRFSDSFIEDYQAESDTATLKKYEKTYGKKGAKVRLDLKNKIMKQNTHGTKSGQWSARKSQKLKKDYEKGMEKKGLKPYKSSKKTESQKDLKEWGDQDWTTKSGKKSSVTGERYLPSKAIDALTDKEYKKTSAAKKKAKKAGKQFSKQPKDIAKKVAKYRAEEELPFGVCVIHYKTTSTVYYRRKPFRKFRGNRHRQQAVSYAQYMANKLNDNPNRFNYRAEEKKTKKSAEYKVGTRGPCWEGYTYVGPQPYQSGSCVKNAEYTAEQEIQDYSIDQLMKSSAVEGDFTQDSLKYSVVENLQAEEDYWAGSVAKAIINEMGDDYYFNKDADEYDCMHFAKEMSSWLNMDGVENEIQSIAGYGGEVAHAWVYVSSEKEYYDAWTPYGVSDWKKLNYWDFEHEQNPTLPHRFETEESKKKDNPPNGWKIISFYDEKNTNYQLQRVVKCKSFEEVKSLIKIINQIADELNHHPLVKYQFNSVVINLWTHDTNSLTDLDFKFANQINDFLNATLRMEGDSFDGEQYPLDIQFNQLQNYIGLQIPWKVDYGDGLGDDVFIGVKVIKGGIDDYDGWVLVDEGENRYMGLDTAMAWTQAGFE